MINKELVQKNFDRGSREYNQYANIQSYICEKLSIYIPRSNRELKILEIGPGTGFLSDVITKRFPNAQIDFIDISPQMLKKLKERLGESSRYNYIADDIEELDLEKKYDFIFSSSCFQWINNLKELFDKLNKSLNKNGQLIFSTFGKNTFIELNTLLKKLFPSIKVSQDFFSSSQIFKYLKRDYRVEKIHVENRKEYYDDLFDFFKYVKKIGANCALEKKESLTKNQLVKLRNEYNRYYKKDNELFFNNNIIYIKANKIGG